MNKIINYLSIFIMCLTYFLIFVGALVKSTESGLSVPDWPTTFGQNMFLFPLSSMVGGIFYEHSHRLIASSVGLCILINAFLIELSNYKRSVKIIAWITLGAVILQGVLGGLTVLFFLPAWLSASHGTLGQTTFCLTIILATITSPKLSNYSFTKSNTYIKMLSIYVIMAVWIQLIIGAIVRHTESGLVALDFPKMNDEWIPSFSKESIKNINDIRFLKNFDSYFELEPIIHGQLLIHFIHRTWGYIVFLFILYFIYLLYKKSTYNYISLILLTLICLQIGLGAFTILTYKHFFITSLHVINGATILGLLVFTSLQLHKSKI